MAIRPPSMADGAKQARRGECFAASELADGQAQMPWQSAGHACGQLACHCVGWPLCMLVFLHGTCLQQP